MLDLEFIPSNPPAKIFSSSKIAEKWLTNVFFKGIVDDVYESILEYIMEERPEDASNLVKIVSDDRATIGVVQQAKFIKEEHTTGFTAARRRKQMIEQMRARRTGKQESIPRRRIFAYMEKKKEVEEKEKQEEDMYNRQRQISLAIERGLQLAENRAPLRHQRNP